MPHSPYYANVRAHVPLPRVRVVLRLLVLLLGGTACTDSRRAAPASDVDTTGVSSALRRVEAVAPPTDAAAPGETSATEPSSPSASAPTTGVAAPSRISAAERFLRQEKQRRGLKQDDDDLRLCGEQTSAMAGILVALCNSGGTAHADSGWVDFYQIEQRQRGTRVKAELLHVDGAGGFGNSGDVSTIDLGEDAPGFLIRGSYGNHGELHESLVVVALLRRGWKEVARLEHLVDNMGSSDCEEHPQHCVHLDFTVRTIRGTTPHDLEAALVGTRGRRRAMERHLLQFDGSRGTYSVPRALKVAP